MTKFDTSEMKTESETYTYTTWVKVEERPVIERIKV